MRARSLRKHAWKMFTLKSNQKSKIGLKSDIEMISTWLKRFMGPILFCLDFKRMEEKCEPISFHFIQVTFFDSHVFKRINNRFFDALHFFHSVLFCSTLNERTNKIVIKMLEMKTVVFAVNQNVYVLFI